jgi:hypothetical protein
VETSYTTSLGENLTINTPTDLKLALYNPTFTGSGFDSLTFTITETPADGLADTLLSKTFNSASAAEAYFSDDVLDLGDASGTFELDLSLTLTDDPAGDGFSTQILGGVQATPEPSTWMLLGVGLVVLFWKIRSRREVPVMAREC